MSSLEWMPLGVLVLLWFVPNASVGGSETPSVPKGDELILGSKRCFECTYHHGREENALCREPTLEGGAGRGACKGRCFIRRDSNGYVYRGCAEPDTYPRISIYVKGCSYQGPAMSLWWWCDGDLCNNQDLMEICQVPDYPFPRRFNVCDGTCRYSSGLYADIHSRRYYIQCGLGHVNDKPCPCCQQYHMKCPKFTEWDDDRKQCIAGQKRPLVFGRGYTYGFNR